MNGKRSNYDQLFISGRRCFYVDPRKDHRIDHFYSWESVPCSFPGSVYVWCRDQLLYSYQKFLIFLLAALLFSFPVYAEDERYEFQNIQNEALYLQGYDLNDYYDHLKYDNTKNDILLLDSNAPYNVLNYDLPYLTDVYYRYYNDQLTMRWYYKNNLDHYSVYRSTGDAYSWVRSDLNIFDNYFIYPSRSSTVSIKSIRLYNSGGYYNQYDIEVDRNNLDQTGNNFVSLVSFIGGKMTAYLEQVATVFTWILTHITELITFILGNPFLAVSLVLFMCGAVISFYVRIKNS